jgi:glc operon protein GlcG
MLRTLLPIAVFVAIAASASAEVAPAAGAALDLAGATRAIAAAKVYARAHNAPGGAIAVVDAGGTLLALERLDGTFAAGANISIGKARTAALFRQRTRVFEEAINNGRTAMTALPADFTPLIGGVPIVVDGHVVGAIGVSGAASAQQDEELALAGAAALGVAAEPLLSAQPIRRFDATAVAAAFAAGAPLVENEVFKVHASRRTAGGQVEVHDDETDVIYVVEGSATLITGGTPVDGTVTARGQYRAARLEGGTTQPVNPGDVLVIPAGVPHWFKEVRGPFLYFTVKPIAFAGAVP